MLRYLLVIGLYNRIPILLIILYYLLLYNPITNKYRNMHTYKITNE